MRVSDEAEWGAQLNALDADDDVRAGKFRDFVVFWAESAETLLDNTTCSPIEALRSVLRFTESQIIRLPVGFLGQAMLILCSHWQPICEDRDGFFDSLTPIEQNIFVDVAAVWVAQRQQSGDEAVVE